MSKDIITNDIHSQVGLCVDFVLKTSLTRQTLDNITSVMLFFEGYEKVFNNTKAKYSGLQDSFKETDDSKKDKELSQSSSSRVQSSVKSGQVSTTDDSSNRKIKTANGSGKQKSIQLSKNSTSHSSIVSNEIKEKETSKGAPIQGNLSNQNSSNNLSSKKSTEMNNNSSLFDKKGDGLGEYMPNGPSTTKNWKAKANVFNQKSDN